MDKNKIVEQLNSYVQGIDKSFSVDQEGGHLFIFVEEDSFAYFKNFEISKFCIWGSKNQNDLIAQTGIIQKFYTKACELLERLNEKKYTIQIVKNDTQSFFNLNSNDNAIVFSGKFESSGWKNEFTPKEIEELKKRQDVAVDWDKAFIKEVEE